MMIVKLNYYRITGLGQPEDNSQLSTKSDAKKLTKNNIFYSSHRIQKFQERMKCFQAPHFSRYIVPFPLPMEEQILSNNLHGMKLKNNQ